MAKARGKRKKRGGGGRRRGGGGGGGGGLMMGMRGGFKNLAGAVTGTGEKSKKRSGWLGTALTVALVIAAAALLLSR